MSTYLITIGAILGIALFGIAVDRLYRAFARNNPQLGPFRDGEPGCGGCSSGGCGGGHCNRD